MKFAATKVEGAFLIELEPRKDDRGFFARSWCAIEYRAQRLLPRIAQINIAWTRKKGTVRGMHFQLAPSQEAKTVRCTRGAIFDVVVDLRQDSPTHQCWAGFELTADDRRSLYIPEGCAHGYQTLADDSEIEYLTTCEYSPAAARGVRFDDPAFGIAWPLPIGLVSESDRSWPDYVASSPN